MVMKRIRFTQSTAEAREHHKSLLKQEGILENQMRMVRALLELLESGRLPRTGPAMTAKQIQSMFEDISNQAVPSSALISVLVKVGVVAKASNRLQLWEVLDAGEKLDHLWDTLRRQLLQVQVDLGRVSPVPSQPREGPATVLAPGMPKPGDATDDEGS